MNVDVFLPLPVDHPFTYAVPNRWSMRSDRTIVMVPFRRRALKGIVVGSTRSRRKPGETVFKLKRFKPFLNPEFAFQNPSST